MNIGVIGAGYVGSVTGSGLAELGHHVTLVDSNTAKIECYERGDVPIYEPGLPELIARNVAAGRLRFSTDVSHAVSDCAVIFVAVGTPPRHDGDADLSAIESVCRDIGLALTGYHVIVEKSTVPVNTCENIRRVIELNNRKHTAWDLVSNPEFLREGCALEDFFSPDRIVVGAESDRARAVMTEVYEPLISGSYHLSRGLPARPATLLLTDIKSAELIKHASNAFLAMKLSFINALSVLAELSGADITDVARGIGLDKRIGGAFLTASLGYGGSCFPKDLKAFYKIAEHLGYDFKLLREVEAINEDQKHRFVRKIRQAVWNINGKKIAVLGLAFKPNTDDIRESPAIHVVRELLKEGAVVRAYDPKAMPNAQAILPEVIYCEDPYQAVQDCDCVVIGTEWAEFRNLDLDQLKASMRYGIIVDGRNCFDPEEVTARGFHYCSIGRGMLEPRHSGGGAPKPSRVARTAADE